MPTPSTKLGINIFSTADQFSTAQYNANWQTLDGSPGFYICTSTTRPVWGANQSGMRITETDTLLTWLWNGTAWIRTWGIGNLGRSSRTTPVGTTSTWTPPGTGTLATALTLSVHPPNGNRLLQIVAELPEIGNPSGLTYIVVQRDATILTSFPVWTTQQMGSGNSGNAGTSGTAYITFDTPNEATAVYTLAFAAATVSGGTTTLVAAPTRPISLTVIET